MTISLKANAAGTQGEILLNGNPVQTFTQNTLQVSGQVLVAGAQSNEYHSLTRKDYVDRLTVFAQIGGYYSGATWVPVNVRAACPLSGVSKIDPFNIVNTSNGRITPTLPGYYMVTQNANVGAAGATFLEVCPLKNGTPIGCGLRNYPTNLGYLDEQGSRITQFNGTTDYIVPGWRLNNEINSGSIDVNDGSFGLIVQYLGPLP